MLLYFIKSKKFTSMKMNINLTSTSAFAMLTDASGVQIFLLNFNPEFGPCCWLQTMYLEVEIFLRY